MWEATVRFHDVHQRSDGLRLCSHVQGGPTKWVEHWMQRLSLAALAADARRCLRRLPGLRAQATRDAVARCHAMAAAAARRA